MADHRWEYCGHCERMTVICGKCGNNMCNGGRGEFYVEGLDEMIPCPGCESAYQLDMKGPPPGVAAVGLASA